MVGIIDYGMGNIHSVVKAVKYLGHPLKVITKVEEFSDVSRLILPGVGNFGKGEEELKKRGIFYVVQDKIKKGVPFLGICLGLHLLFEKSEEAPQSEGLGILKGEVRRFPQSLIVPHMGWNRVEIKNSSLELFKNIPNGSYFYFAHSYYVFPKDENIILGYTTYQDKFPSVIYQGNILGVQFHLEKSQKIGLTLLDNFLRN